MNGGDIGGEHGQSDDGPRQRVARQKVVTAFASAPAQETRRDANADDPSQINQDDGPVKISTESDIRSVGCRMIYTNRQSSQATVSVGSVLTGLCLAKGMPVGHRFQYELCSKLVDAVSAPKPGNFLIRLGACSRWQLACCGSPVGGQTAPASGSRSSVPGLVRDAGQFGRDALVHLRNPRLKGQAGQARFGRKGAPATGVAAGKSLGPGRHRGQRDYPAHLGHAL